MNLKEIFSFLGTTDYGFELSGSDKNKFKELNTKLNVYVFTYGLEEKEIDFQIVKIKYLKRPKTIIFKYFKILFLKYIQVE